MNVLDISGEPTHQLPVSDGGPTGGHPSPATVLLAEDDDAMRESMRLWLTNDGEWEVREASDGEQALSRLDGSVDVLVLDRRMPELSGPEIVDRIDETGVGVNVVVVSAYQPDSHLAEDDVATYLTKPVDRETFLTQLQETLG